MPAPRKSERRAERLLDDLLSSQGWDRRGPPHGDLYLQREYQANENLKEALSGASKTGEGAGVPEAILMDRDSNRPLAVIEIKAVEDDIDSALEEAKGYGKALIDSDLPSLAIGLAGTNEDGHRLLVSKWVDGNWAPVTYDKCPINWIPNRNDCRRLLNEGAPADLRPSVPPAEVLAEKADEINRLLREADIKDEFRPSHVAAVMLALWHTGGDIRRGSGHILQDVKEGCRNAFQAAGQAGLANSIHVDQANKKLRDRAPRIATILERLNVTVLTAEHDYLGHLYETFFRHTGGNTIGQYFTPRHIARMMVDICGTDRDDTLLDIACGTGGFFVAHMDRLANEDGLPREDVAEVVSNKIIGFESEPVTAALCAANMILRGDGSTRIRQADSLGVRDFPDEAATVALMNPPFPHRNTDTPVERFVERGLEGLRLGGKLAVIVPSSLLSKGGGKGRWRGRILRRHSLLAVCQLPDELFQPFASITTSMILLEKGRPHRPRRRTAFVRLRHDGLVLRKSVRVPSEDEPNQIPDAIDAIYNKDNAPGFCAAAGVSGDGEWSAGAHIESAPPGDDELRAAIDVQLRRMASFYARYAVEIIAQQWAVARGEIDVRPYRDTLSERQRLNAERLPSEPGTIGGEFDIYYGMKELHSREGMGPGETLIISPREDYNGTYGWLDFPRALPPGFVTVAQTGSIGEAFVQMEPCAVNDDCLVLLPRNPREGKPDLTTLVFAAATLHAERWRFNYGRKLTPSRIHHFALPQPERLRRWVSEKIAATMKVIAASLTPYGPPPGRNEPRNGWAGTSVELASGQDGNLPNGPGPE